MLSCTVCRWQKVGRGRKGGNGKYQSDSSPQQLNSTLILFFDMFGKPRVTCQREGTEGSWKEGGGHIQQHKRHI